MGSPRALYTLMSTGKSLVIPTRRRMSNLMMSIPMFATEHGISRSLLYKLLAEGRGPRITKISGRTLISAEAAAEWRSRLERDTEQPRTKH